MYRQIDIQTARPESMTGDRAFNTVDEFLGPFYDHVADMIVHRHAKKQYIDDPINERVMEGLLEDLEDWVKRCEEADERDEEWVPDEFEALEFWNTLTARYESTHHWREWNKEDSAVIYPLGHPKRITKGKGPYQPSEYLGYSSKLVSSTILRQKSLIKHKYSEKPPDVEWNLTEITQGKKRALIGDAVINEIDAVSSVPWLDPMMSAEDFARSAPDPRSLKNEWQRVVSLGRINDISKFANDEGNSMFNPVTLFVDLSDDNVKLTKNKRRHAGNDRYKLKIGFDFLKKDIGKTLTDFVTKPKEHDLRPLWIVDGQHRVRGYAKSHVGFEYRIPIVVLTSTEEDDARREVAKIFTEINTLAEPIEAKHQIFLKYRFGIKKDRTDDFSIKTGSRKRDWIGDPDNPRSRVNRRAYELGLSLAKGSDSALNNSIQFTGEKGRQMPRANIVDIIQWMKEVTPWFKAGSIYSEDDSDKFFKEEVSNFFVAFAESANKADWPCDSSGWGDKRNRWNIPANAEGNLKPLLQQAPFIVLLRFYPKLVHHMTHKNVKGEVVEDTSVTRPISRKKFRELLEATSITNIDWRDTDFKTEFKGRNNTNIPHLVDFMITCVRKKAKFPSDVVMSDKIHSKPGQGIRSKPARRAINFGTSVKSIPKSSQVELVMERPYHALKANWSAQAFLKGKSESETFEIKKSWIKTSAMESKLFFKGSDVRKQFPSISVERIEVQASWLNHNGTSTNSNKTLKRT